MEGQNRVRVEVNLNDGSVLIESDADNLDHVFDRLESFFRNNQGWHKGSNGPETLDEVPAEASPSETAQKSEVSGKKTRAKSSKNPVRYKTVTLSLTDDQPSELREFFLEKNPKTQNDQVAVLGVFLKRVLKREEFDMDEIHTALKLVGKPTPKDLTSVFRNMRGEGMCDSQGRKISITSLTDDYVDFRMKAVKADASDD
ncbi:MAG: hypothetical protein NXH87_09320 [Rhodobiaceae bacterium]|nr:hypothetical protein [Rhodobiaceae bacterium]